MNNTTIINIFNGDNSSIAYINTRHCQVITTIAFIVLKVESMIKKSKVKNYAFFAVVTFTRSIPFLRSILL